MNPTYQHTQPFTMLLVTLGGVFLFELIIFLVAHAPLIIVGIILVFFIALAALLSSLTITIDGEAVRWRFGVGLFHGKIPLADIRELQTVRNPWWYGWGMRLTPRGWLYNVSGLDAVELTLANGKHIGLGTDEPQILLNAIQDAQRTSATMPS